MKKTVLQISELDADELLKEINSIKSGITKIHEKFTPQFTTQLMTRQEVADFYKVSLVTVHDWLKKGWLISYRIGNRTRFKRHEVEEAMNEIRRKRKGGGNG